MSVVVYLLRSDLRIFVCLFLNVTGLRKCILQLFTNLDMSSGFWGYSRVC